MKNGWRQPFQEEENQFYTPSRRLNRLTPFSVFLVVRGTFVKKLTSMTNTEGENTVNEGNGKFLRYLFKVLQQFFKRISLSAIEAN